MADQSLIERLKQGVVAWNEWKANQPGTPPLDLSETDFAEVNVHLDGIDLTFCNLQGCNFSGFQAAQAHFDSADLQGANLSRTNLRSAHFFGADLSHALLAGAVLRGANFHAANLTGANLSGADLSQADLSCARLNGAILTGADLSRTDFLQTSLKGTDFSSCLFGGLTVFGQLDLSEARGLDRIRHDGTVILDILSIYMSAGNIPEPLLRAASLPESFLTLIPTLDFEEEEGDAKAP
ncbi:MAG TPA: pentapeptide repeat-containing protein [Ktedonosporobacter sp.]|nr:pentapeptide repeat-containing protein [Ktedonosporobacter sp.]